MPGRAAVHNAAPHHEGRGGAFYTLHVWARKDSPNGMFVNWNSNVSCDGFKGQ